MRARAPPARGLPASRSTARRCKPHDGARITGLCAGRTSDAPERAGDLDIAGVCGAGSDVGRDAQRTARSRHSGHQPHRAAPFSVAGGARRLAAGWVVDRFSFRIETRVPRVRCLCPSISWMYRTSAPSSMCVAIAWRNTWHAPVLPAPARNADRCEHSGRSGSPSTVETARGSGHQLRPHFEYFTPARGPVSDGDHRLWPCPRAPAPCRAPHRRPTLSPATSLRRIRQYIAPRSLGPQLSRSACSVARARARLPPRFAFRAGSLRQPRHLSSLAGFEGSAFCFTNHLKKPRTAVSLRASETTSAAARPLASRGTGTAGSAPGSASSPATGASGSAPRTTPRSHAARCAGCPPCAASSSASRATQGSAPPRSQIPPDRFGRRQDASRAEACLASPASTHLAARAAKEVALRRAGTYDSLFSSPLMCVSASLTTVSAGFEPS